jgi:cytochrome c oxidase cbb3-type subunit 1
MWIAGVHAGPDVARDQFRRHADLRVREAVKANYPFYAISLLGGVLFLAGMLLMAWNVMRTIAVGKAAEAPIPPVPARSRRRLKSRGNHEAHARIHREATSAG